MLYAAKMTIIDQKGIIPGRGRVSQVVAQFSSILILNVATEFTTNLVGQ